MLFKIGVLEYLAIFTEEHSIHGESSIPISSILLPKIDSAGT